MHKKMLRALTLIAPLLAFGAALIHTPTAAAQSSECNLITSRAVIITIPEIDLSDPININLDDIEVPEDINLGEIDFGSIDISEIDFSQLPKIPSQTITVRLRSRTFNPDCYSVGDDRVNQDNAADVAIYCRPEGIAFWDIDITGRGTFSFLVTYDLLLSIPDNLPGNVLVAEHGGFQLYKLTNNQLQVNSPPDWEGKSYTFIWDGCLE
jgi:hypothetical protein